MTKKKNGDHAHLLFTETDSLNYVVVKAVTSNDMVNSREIYDLSNYTPTNPKYNPDFGLKRAKVGLMEDEVP